MSGAHWRGAVTVGQKSESLAPIAEMKKAAKSWVRPMEATGTTNIYAAMEKAAAKLHERTFVRTVRLANGIEPDHLSGDELRGEFGFMLS